MARSCIFFLVLILLVNARGGRVLRVQSAQNGQRDSEKALQAPRSFSPEQQASSVSSGVQSFEDDDGSSNRRRSLVRLIPNTHGASSSSDKLSSVAQNDASGPVSAPASGSRAGEVIAQGFPKPSLSAQAQNEQTAQADEPLNCAHPRRQNPSYRVRVPFKPPNPTNQFVNGSQGSLGSTRDSLASHNLQDNYEVNPSGYADGFASTRLSSQTSPQTLPTQYDPPFRVPASNRVAPSQSLGIAPVQSQQGGSSFQSRWYASQGQRIQSGAGPSTPTQVSSVLPPSQSLPGDSLLSQQDGYSFQSRWSASRAQSIPAASGSTSQTQPSNFLDLYQGLGAAPVSSQQDSSRFQSRWSASQGQNLAVTQPMLQTQSSNLLPPSQGLARAPLASQQDNYSAQPSWSTSQWQSLAATQPKLQTQAANLVNPFQSLGTAPLPSQQDSSSFQSRWSARQNLADPQPIPQSQAQFGYRSQASAISTSRDVGSSSMYTSAQSQGVQLSQFEALNQSPGVQTQSLYELAFPSQGVAGLYTSPLQSQAGSDSLGVQWHLVSSDGLMALQRGSLGSLYNPSASIRFQSGTVGVVPQSQSALIQGGVQPPAIQSNSRSFTSSQNAASPLASVAQSSMIDITALQRQNLATPQLMPQTEAPNFLGTSQNLATAPILSQQDGSRFQPRWSASQEQNIPSASGFTFQAQPSNLVAPSQSLGTAPMPSQPDGFNAQSSWSAPQGQSVSAIQPMRQTQASNLVASSQSLPSGSLSSQQEGYGFQASWYATQGQSNPLTTGPKLQTPVSSILGPSQSSPVPAEQGGYGFQWSASQGQNFPSVSQPNQYSPGLQAQSSSRHLGQLPSLYSSPLQSQAGSDSSGVQWQWVSSDGLMALQRGSLGSLFNPAASIRFQSGTFGVVPQSQSAQGGVQPPAIQSNSRFFTSSQNTASALTSMTERSPSVSWSLGQTTAEPVASVASNQNNPSAAWTTSNMHLYGA